MDLVAAGTGGRVFVEGQQLPALPLPALDAGVLLCRADLAAEAPRDLRDAPVFLPLVQNGACGTRLVPPVDQERSRVLDGAGGVDLLDVLLEQDGPLALEGVPDDRLDVGEGADRSAGLHVDADDLDGAAAAQGEVVLDPLGLAGAVAVRDALVVGHIVVVEVPARRPRTCGAAYGRRCGRATVRGRA